jgi:hypothetical protein
MALTPGQRERMRQLLEEELRKAVLSAIERGATPEEVADLLAERRRTVDEIRSDSTIDPQQSPGDEKASGRPD